MSFLQRWFTTMGTTKEEINIDSKLRALAFLPSETPRIISGEEGSAQLRRLEDHLMGEAIESNTSILAVAASNDGKWIVTGATDGFTIWKVVQGGGVPDKVVRHPISGVRAIDISLDSKWVITGSDARTADVWELSTGQRRPGLGPLKHEFNVVAVKFCPCGERVATATLFGSIRIYATNTGQKLLTIPVSVRSTLAVPTITLAWFSNRPQMFVVSQGQIKCLYSDDGSISFQWPIRGVSHPSSVILSPNHKLIAYSANDTVVLRDTATGQQLGDALKHDVNVSCIAFSAGSDHLVAGADTKCTIWNLRKLLTDTSYFLDVPIKDAKSCVNHNQDPTVKSRPTTFSLPLVSIGNPAVKPWLHGFLKHAEEALSTEIDQSVSSRNHNAFANRALIRARRENGSGALEDAKRSLAIEKSPIGQIAKTIALIRLGENGLARQEASNLLKDYDSNQHKFLLEIIQSILLCLSGEYDEEGSHISRLRTGQNDQKLLLLVQANIHLAMEEFELAKESFKKAEVPAIFPHDETQEMQSLSYIFGWKFSGLGIQIQQEKCEFLLARDDPEAANLFLGVTGDYQREIAMHVELSEWALVFRRDCLKKLEDLGDKALASRKYEKAIRQYTAVEHLMGDPDLKHALLLKRSEAHAGIGGANWTNALHDAEEAIILNPSSPWGYDKKHDALYACQHYPEAAAALDQVITSLTFSQDAESTKLRGQGVKPGETRQIVIGVVDETLSQPRPHQLIDTNSGGLCDKDKQKEAFRADPDYKKLVLSPTERVKADTAWQEAVRQYFRYAIFSHTWETRGEPEFSDVKDKSVDTLAVTFPNTKLKTFCKKAREHGYRWAWSDTCCINKSEKDVWDISLRSMYRWYFESSLTIVHLKGVLHQLGIDVDPLDELLQEFVHCRWNERAWTLQEYFASKVIHFYTEDWKPYLPITHTDPGHPINHKYHRTIQRGMELVTGLDKDRLAALQPGSGDARQKLRLASMRQAKRGEDIAYALLGVFKVTIPTIYGDDEAPRALGRLLEALLTQSADITILAWTGKPSEYNTCLPADITVYREEESRHVPRPIGEEATLDASVSDMVQGLSPTDLDSVVKLHEHLIGLPPPKIHHGRLELPCISFQLSLTPDPSSRSYAARAPLLNDVVLRETEDLSSARNPVLVHPWFSYLLDPSIPYSDHARRRTASRLFAALGQPFGALLLSLDTTYRSYERIATNQLIKAQIRADVTPEQLLENIRVLYIR